MKQLSLLRKHSLIHGGSVTPGHAQTARPLCTKRPIHLTMRSSKAVGAKSLWRHKKEVETIVRKAADAWGVRIYEFANGGNHLHLIVKIHNQKLFKNFLRVVTGLIARLVLKAQKAHGKLKLGEKFWDARPFTRIANWGKAFEQLRSYLVLNQLEALGFVEHQRRDHRRRKLLSIKIEPIVIRS